MHGFGEDENKERGLVGGQPGLRRWRGRERKRKGKSEEEAQEQRRNKV